MSKIHNQPQIPHNSLLKFDSVLEESNIKEGESFYEIYKKFHSDSILKFESVNYLFLMIIEKFYNNAHKLTDEKLDYDYQVCLNQISCFWNEEQHPYVALLNLVLARLNVFFRAHSHKNEIEYFYKQSFEKTKISLGKNIYLANLCVKIGNYFIHEKLKDAIDYFLIANSIYHDLEEEFYDHYLLLLKNISKYYFILGNLKYSLEFGMLLIKKVKEKKNSIDTQGSSFDNYFNPNKQTDKNEQNNDSTEDFNILLNLIDIAKSLNANSEGVEICRSAFMCLHNNQRKSMSNNSNIQTVNYRKWTLEEKIDNEVEGDEESQKQFDLNIIFSKYLTFVINEIKSESKKAGLISEKEILISLISRYREIYQEVEDIKQKMKNEEIKTAERKKIIDKVIEKKGDLREYLKSLFEDSAKDIDSLKIEDSNFKWLYVCFNEAFEDQLRRKKK